MIFFGGLGHDPKANSLDFGDDPDPLSLYAPIFKPSNAFSVR